ncbi:bifunctional diaminohydroxyphosphoribosylaminopyrimidine deaminase/5-amino-6-(5-phosphoribosylamino)uracil reductase RibD [Necropsobacter massiliensis]|uniref:bifunctional diaminohydroxyphosphoribosylaminopyrimidine deaminase/5-amino-6-(5-phosphoribosylamino)uracil reductase RibD n=1 Tax=Necropsobacter massiliensis TaxID=1400001 RepID=UPI000595B5D0|nr:bifunctional diaminohydroxyphosphoribosylaminopyrimidine deaminase/5-amino-6-(5-phosphoribosylamino)uracil reductase RibD [Necropsobacter massiliensis]
MQPQFTEHDVQYMQQALALAGNGIFTTAPNPAVGCVLVKDGNVVGKGFHFKAGQPHAEVMALMDAGERARGATAYVTLEPCSHFGRTPPCAKALIDAGVSRVIAAMQDPNPQVAGQGLAMLRAGGVETAVGLLQEQAELLNKGFLKRMRCGMPFVQLKMAISIDGKTAMASGESKWITGELSRRDVQTERAKASAILSTGKTVAADDPLLNVRWQQLPDEVRHQYRQANLRQPVRIILDNQHLVQPIHRLFHIPAPVWLVSRDARDMSDFPDFCQHIRLEVEDGQDSLYALLSLLGQRQINSLWVEAGAGLAGALIERNLVDELIVYVAPKLLGNQARGLYDLSHIQRLADAPLWALQSVRQIDMDVKMIYRRQDNS